MSKEKQCECCHEWWYSSDIKDNLCPNCYDYFKQLKQKLAEKDKEIESIKQQLEETNAGYDFTYEQSIEAIKELKQNQTQLAIEELEKVKNFICDYSEITGQAWNHTLRFLNNRIKELK